MSSVTGAVLNERLMPLETSLRTIKEATDELAEKFNNVEMTVLSRDAEIQRVEERLESIAKKVEELEKLQLIPLMQAV